MIYLDNSATTRVLPEAAKAALEAMTEQFYNPASAYPPAVEAERAVNGARAHIAQSLGCTADEIIFTSGGTESNNMAVFGTLKPLRGKHRIITSLVEHPSVYETFRSLEGSADAEVVLIGCKRDGTADLDELEQALTDETALVSLMHVNNEVGAVNGLAAVSDILKKRAPNAVFHSDGVQAFGKLPFTRVPCDLYSISAHKLHAPKGVGALAVRNGFKFAGGQIGGGQEKNLRSGTTNVPGILGMDAALAAYRAHQPEWLEQMRACKLRLANALLSLPDTAVNGPIPEEGAPHILNVSFLGVRGEVLLNALAERGVYVSTGSACSTHQKGKNRILSAMGISGARAEGAIRFSLCAFNTLEEMDQTASVIAEQIAFLRRFQRR
ncbi:MAG TPA: cysteine desulfurase family protein [Feifaniaceae bacterium]|nr:cysteine desulfurase family protein [Feifaniaceae bacterium]